MPIDLIGTTNQMGHFEKNIMLFIVSSFFIISGQTWLLTILYLMDNAAKIEKGEEVDKFDLEAMKFAEMKYPTDGELGVDKIRKLPPPRVIKTHLPLRYWQKQLEQDPDIKVIQIISNPKDVLVSLYHFYRMNKGLGLYLGTWDDFFELIRNDQLVYGDLFPQVAEWYSFNKDRENSMILVYEDMKVDLKGNLIKLNQFLGKNISESTLDLIAHKVTFDNMKKDPKINVSNFTKFEESRSKFLRKGTVGDWKNYFNEEQNNYIEKRTKEYFDSIGLNVQYSQ